MTVLKTKNNISERARNVYVKMLKEMSIRELLIEYANLPKEELWRNGKVKVEISKRILLDE